MTKNAATTNDFAVGDTVQFRLMKNSNFIGTITAVHSSRRYEDTYDISMSDGVAVEFVAKEQIITVKNHRSN